MFQKPQLITQEKQSLNFLKKKKKTEKVKKMKTLQGELIPTHYQLHLLKKFYLILNIFYYIFK